MNASVTTLYSQEAEEATIGAILVSPQSYFMVSAFLTADSFFILRNRYVWEAIEKLHEKDEPIDYLTVYQKLKDSNRLDELGGGAYLTQLINATPTSVHAEVYGRLVESFATRRRLMVKADKIKALALDTEITIDTVLGDAARLVTEVQVASAGEDESTWFDDVSQYYGRVESMIKDQTLLRGMPTGFYDLDKIILGLNAPDFLVLAGRPGMGKTAFMLCLLLNVMKADPERVCGLFSLEMSREQVTERIASIESKINLQSLREGNVSDSEWGRFVKQMGEVSSLGLLIDDRSHISPQQIRAKIYKWLAQRRRLDLVIVDYLQLMNAPGFKPTQREQEVSFISRELKGMAKEFNIPILALAQLNRAVEKQKNKRPGLADLRESGAIEQDADVVMFVYRDEVYTKSITTRGVAEIITAKHRHGPTGTAYLLFEDKYAAFRNKVKRPVEVSAL